MAPIREYLCRDCGHQFEEIRGNDPEEADPKCPHECEGKVERLPALPGGYFMNSGSASTKPRTTTRRPSGK